MPYSEKDFTLCDNERTHQLDQHSVSTKADQEAQINNQF